jgi:hypothetical protein
MTNSQFYLYNNFEPTIDVYNMPNPLDLMAYIGIANTHTARLYFRATLSVAGSYSNYDRQLGYVDSQASKMFIYTLNRAMPSLTNGEFDESVTIQIHAYTDDGYSNEVISDSLSLTFHYIDHTHPSWTVLDHSNFDNYNPGIWGELIEYNCLDIGAFYPFSLSSANWLTAPYGMASQGPLYDAFFNYHRFNLAGRTKVYFIIHCRSGNNIDLGGSIGVVAADIIIRINWQLAKPTICPAPATNTWYRYAFKCPTADNMEIAFQATDAGVSIDELWMIAK